MARGMSFSDFQSTRVEEETTEVIEAVEPINSEMIDVVEIVPEEIGVAENDAPIFANPFPIESAAYFPVEARPLEISLNGATVIDPDRKVIFRSDTNKVFGIHKKNYQLVKNNDVFPMFEEALIRSSLDLSGAYVQDKLVMHGAKTIRDYFFPAHRVDISSREVGDVVDMRLRVVNSYDGTCCFGYMLGAYRLICENGLVIGHELNSHFVKHTIRFDQNSMVNNLESSLELYLSHSDVWNKWVDKVITTEQVLDAIDAFPAINLRLKNTFIGYWNAEQAKLGPTVWALFNALTFWSSHHKIKNSRNAGHNEADVILLRESRVEQFMRTPQFQLLAG